MQKRLYAGISVFIILSSLFTPNLWADSNGNFARLGADKFKIAIFKEAGFPSISGPDLLTPEWLYEILSEEFSVIYLNVDELSDSDFLNNEKVDLLILPFGEAFPHAAFTSIKNYIYKGGGIFNLAGRPFWVPIERINDKWQRVSNVDPYENFLAPLGIKYYELADENAIGLTVATSLKATPIVPTHGNVFPYRIPARDFFHSELLRNHKHNESIIFVESWLNPYDNMTNDIPKKWALIGNKDDIHPLNPVNRDAKRTLLNIIRQISFPVVLSDLSTEMPVYKPGEEVRIFAKASNLAKEYVECIVEFRVYDNNEKIIFKRNKKIGLKGGDRISIEQVWHPKDFKSNFYKVQVSIKIDGITFEKKENGFLVINKAHEKNPALSIKGDEFYVDSKPALILGTNYYESKIGELMWVAPNILKIRDDFKSMQDLGINFVRIHYHHSKWFRDYYSDILKMDIPSCLQGADKTVLPSERSMRILDALIYLALEHDMIFCMDLFTLVPREMGNPLGWIGLKERITEQEKIESQLKFIKIISERYKAIPGIVWDLWNEPRLADADLELLRKWVLILKKAFSDNGDTHLITIGGQIGLKLIDILDYASVHTGNPVAFNNLKQLGKPFIFGEVWNDAGSSLEEENRQSEKMRNDLSEFLKTEAAGFVPWQWTRQARLWNDTSEPEKWDDELGCCVHDDGSLKPAGKEYYSLINSIKKANVKEVR